MKKKFPYYSSDVLKNIYMLFLLIYKIMLQMQKKKERIK